MYIFVTKPASKHVKKPLNHVFFKIKTKESSHPRPGEIYF